MFTLYALAIGAKSDLTGGEFGLTRGGRTIIGFLQTQLSRDIQLCQDCLKFIKLALDANVTVVSVMIKYISALQEHITVPDGW